MDMVSVRGCLVVKWDGCLKGYSLRHSFLDDIGPTALTWSSSWKPYTKLNSYRKGPPLYIFF